MDNIDYNEIFGIDETAQTAPEAAEAAPPAQEVQEAAKDTAPAEEAQEGAQEAHEAKQTEQAGQKPEQNPDERARQAAGRRIREREFAAGREAARAEFSAMLSRLGLTDPGTGEPVDTADKLEAYEKSLSEQRIAKGKATEEDIRRIAREELAGQPAQQQPAQQQAAPTEAEFSAELEEIKRLDPEMTDLGTILRSEAGPKFREYVERGLNFVDAYTLAARNRIAQRQAGQAQEAARVKAAGKDHLSATQSRGGEADIPVPADELELFRAMMPEMSDTEFRKYWNKNRKKG